MKRGWVWGIVAAVVVVGAVVAFVVTRPVERFVYGVLALSKDEALLATRWNDETSRSFIELVGPSELRWAAELTPLEVPTTLGLVEAAADASQVYVVAAEEGASSSPRVVVSALDRGTGAPRWTKELRASTKGYGMPYTEAVRVAGSRVLVLLEDEGLVVHALDVATGALAWTAPAGSPPGRAFEVGPTQVAVLGTALTRFELADGRPAGTWAARGATCRHEDTLLVAAVGSFREVSLGGGADRELAAEGGLRWMEACARSGERWVVAGRTDERLVAQAIGEGGVAWTAALPGTGLSTLGGPSNGAVQGGGELEGRWPLVVYDTDAAGAQVDRLVILDVVAGRIVSEREGEGGGLRIPGARPGQGHALVGARVGAVTLLDASAEPVRTLRLTGLDLVRSHAADGHLWLVQLHQFSPPGEHDRMVVELATGRTVGGFGVPFADDSRHLDAAFPRLGWYRLRPEGEGFEVALPGEPERQTSKVAGPQGHEAELVQYNYSSDDVALVVSVSPLVKQLVEHGNVELALDRTLDSQVNQPGRTLKSKQAITFQGHPGREADVELELEQGIQATLRLRLVMVGLRIHMQLAIWPRGAEPAQIGRFFDSFSLVGEPVRSVGIDLWIRHELPELGLSVELPKKPHFDRLTQRTAFGQAEVARADADSSFPPASYSLQRLPVPSELLAAGPAATLEAWAKAVVAGEAGLAYEVVERAEVDALGGRGLRLRLRETPARDGVGDVWHLGLVRDGALLDASMQALGPATGETEALRFLASLRAR